MHPRYELTTHSPPDPYSFCLEGAPIPLRAAWAIGYVTFAYGVWHANLVVAEGREYTHTEHPTKAEAIETLRVVRMMHGRDPDTGELTS